MDDNENLILEEGEYFTEINGIQVPQNICHRFRTKITTSLLADLDKVARDQPYEESLNAVQPVPVYRRAQTAMTTGNDDYAKISRDLRSSICYGHPVERSSHTKMTHNKNIFDKSAASNNAYRRKKDWLGKWTEANIVRERLYKNVTSTKKSST